MKKVILSVCAGATMLIFSCTNKDSQTKVEIPDANFKAYLLQNFDSNKDGYLTLSEVKKVKEINCSGQEIKSLDGIEKFENLESLDCSNNQLNEVEIRHNHKLQKLVCTGNNEGMFLYIGMKSPLKNPAVQKPADNAPPQMADMATGPLDESKCTYDKDKTNISISFID